jgi:hypothetical protein
MMPSTVTVSPSLSHHRASHTWHEQNTTSVESGSVIAISMTEFWPQATHVRPDSGALSMLPSDYRRVVAQRRLHDATFGPTKVEFWTWIGHVTTPTP